MEVLNEKIYNVSIIGTEMRIAGIKSFHVIINLPFNANNFFIFSLQVYILKIIEKDGNIETNWRIAKRYNDFLTLHENVNFYHQKKKKEEF